MRSNIRVFLGVREVSGHYEGLREGFRQIGVLCDYINIESNEFEFDAGTQSKTIRLLRHINYKRKNSINPINSRLWAILQSFLHLYLFVVYVLRCDYFIFSAGGSFFRLRDLPILKAFGKKIIFQFHGSDSRLPFIDGARYSEVQYTSECAWADTIAMQRRMRVIERYADHIVNIQPQAHLFSRPYIQWLLIGVATKPAQTLIEEGLGLHKTRKNRGNPQTIKIIHAPSLRSAKGSDAIRVAIEKLKGAGAPIDYEEVTGLANSQLRRKLLGADLVIDQLYSDYPMPSLATECAWLHIPVLVFGYAKAHWAKWLPSEYIPPTCYREPEHLESVLQMMIQSPQERFHIAEICFDFVSSRWEPALIAERYLSLFKNKFPQSWYAEEDNSYRIGACLARDKAEQRIANLGQKAEVFFINR